MFLNVKSSGHLSVLFPFIYLSFLRDFVNFFQACLVHNFDELKNQPTIHTPCKCSDKILGISKS